MDACTNPDILRVIWFFLMIIDIVKIIIPIALIILGIVDFSKSMITNDDGVQKKNTKLFAKRILYAILVFIVPWMVEVIIVNLGNFLGEEGVVNFTDCLENANGDTIQSLEEGKGVPACWQCNNNDSLYKWDTSGGNDANCPGGWHERKPLSKEDCGVKKCHMCTANGARYWGVNTSNSGINCPTSWVFITETEENCK